MQLTILALCYLGMVVGNTDTCIKGPDNTCVAPAGDDESNLIQTHVHVHSHKFQARAADHGHKTSRKRITYSSYIARPAMEYFKHWSHGKVDHHLKNFVLSVSGKAPAAVSLTSMNTTAVDFLHMHRLRACPSMAKAARKLNYQLHDTWNAEGEFANSVPVEHFVLRSSTGSLQYYAKHGKHIISAYPNVCPEALMQRHRARKVKGQGKMKRKAKDSPDGLNATAGEESGGEKNLALDDPLVMDCIELFHRTAVDKCEEDFNMTVLSALDRIIDGIAIEMAVMVGNKTHDIVCEFEVPGGPNNTDAKLLQKKKLYSDSRAGSDFGSDFGSGSGYGSGDVLDVEEKGLTTTLVMEIDLCKADEESTMSEEDKSFFLLAQKQKLGELSRYKGFEHVNDKLPMVTESVLQTASKKQVPDSYDIRTEYPGCFLDDHGECVRDQGQCGSCWAFASASATMNNLCVSGNGGTQSVLGGTDRYEVSVQQIMSCNSDKVGCDGGYASAADDAMDGGITRERDSGYKCGGGDPLNHFDASSDSCKAFPWAGTCSTALAYGGWNWGGASGVDGEDAMKALISQGHSLYASFDVYANFMSLGAGEIFTATEGSKKGGHAVVAVAYGAKDGTKYWVLQNSWGTTWGDNGYGMILRGTNLCGIETGAYYMRAWVSTADAPPCLDASSSGLVGGSGPIPCSQAKDGPFGDLCTSWAHVVGANCPTACGSCPGGTSGPVPMPGADPSPSPSPSATTTAEPGPPGNNEPSTTASPTTASPTPTPGTTTTPEPGSPSPSTTTIPGTGPEIPTDGDGSGWGSYSGDWGDWSWSGCGGGAGSGEVPSGTGCKDSDTYTDPYFGDSCALWVGWICDGFDFSMELKDNCPVACNAC